MINEFIEGYLRSWKNHSVIQATTLLVLTGTFFVVTLFVSVYQNLDQVLTQWGEDVEMTAFLNDDINLETLNEIGEKIDGNEFVKAVKYISKDQAVETFLSQMGSFAPDLIEDKNFSNPLPASYEIELTENLGKASSFDKLVALAEFVKTLPGVDEVSYGQGWIENYSSLVSQFARSSWAIVSILLAGSLLIVGNAIRSSVFARRDEIEVLELVGATRNRIRVPFLLEGAVLGFTSALLAVIFCWAFMSWQSDLIVTELAFLGLSGSVQALSFEMVLLIPVFGAVIGAGGAFLCVQRLSTGWAAAERLEQW